MIPGELLSAFDAVADELSYTRAAARLYVSQPALTKRIQQLERRLGLALFARTRRSVRLTPAGEGLWPHARAALGALTALDSAAVRIRDGTEGRLRIGFSPSAPHHVLPRLMRAFRRCNSGVACELSEVGSDAQVHQLLAGDLDVGILRPPVPVPAGLQCRVFLEEPFVVVLPRNHPLARLPEVPLRRLGSEPFVLIARKVSAMVHDRVRAACATAGFSPCRVTEVAHVHAVVSLVSAGCGVSLLPRSVADIGIREVVCLPLRGDPIFTRVAVAHPRRGASPAALALAETALGLDPAGDP